MEKFAFKWAPNALDPDQNTFSAKRAFKHWERLSISVTNRHMSTFNYNQSYDYVYSEIKKYKAIADQSGILKISIEEQLGEVYESKVSKIIQVERDARNLVVLVELSGSEKMSKSPIMISAHIDGKNRGPAAYDDAAGIAAMLEMLNLLVESKNPPSRPIILLFVGVEELGLQGSKLFLKYQNCSENQTQLNGCFLSSENNYKNIASMYLKNSSSFLNIESLGPGMPLGIMQKGEGSAGTIYALKNTKGLIFGTFADDVTKLGLITSTSDAVRFRMNGFAGAELLFFGNPTKYHTQLDSISTNSDTNNEIESKNKFIFTLNKILNYKTKPINHLQLLGNSLTNYVFNFDKIITSTTSKTVVAAVGISPFALVMDIKFSKMCGITISFISIISIILSKSFSPFQILLAFLFVLLSFLATTFILLSFGVLHFKYNSLVYARSTIFSFNYLLFCGLFVYLFVLSLFNSIRRLESVRKISSLSYQHAMTLFFCILCSVLSHFELDSSLMFVWQILFAFVSNVLFMLSPLLAFVSTFVGFLYIDFSLFLLFTFMTRYTSMIPNIAGDLVPFVMISIFILFLSFAFTPFIVREGKKQNEEEEKEEEKEKENEKSNDRDNKKDDDVVEQKEKEVVNPKSEVNKDSASLNESGSKICSSLVFVMFLLSLVLLSLPLLAPPPYNKATYNVQGDIAHIIDPSNGSYVAFSPVQRMRVFRGVSKIVQLDQKSIQTQVDFEMPISKRAVFMRNVSNTNLPSFIKKWPLFSISVTNETEERRNVVVLVPEENEDLIAVNLVVNCGSTSCIEKVNKIGNINESHKMDGWVSSKEDFNVTNFELKDVHGFRYVLRVMPGFQPSLFNFTVVGKKLIPMKITFTWDTLTDEAKKLLDDLPDFIQPFGRMRSIDDTTLVNYTYI